MPQGTKISFVVFPDGKIDEGSLTIGGETAARERFIAGWLPERFFGNAPTGYGGGQIWRGAYEKGARSYTIELDKDGKPTLVKD
jgi:hypothetical protein